MTANFTDGHAYERLMGRWSQAVGVSFLKWLQVEQGTSWLDVGCGTGAFSEVLVQHAAPLDVAGLDPSAEQIAFALQRPTTRDVWFNIGDAQALPFRNARFDVTVMALVIAFVPDPAKAVHEMARVTVKGGQVASYMWDLLGGGVPLQPVDQALKALGHKRPMPPSAVASTQDSLLALWQGANLINIRTTQIRIDVSFPDFDDFCASTLLPVGPLGAYIAALPHMEQQAIVEQLRKQMKPDPQGRITYEACANAITGTV